MGLYAMLAVMLVLVAAMIRWAIREDKRRRMTTEMQEGSER
jgi:hypothetical protein